MNLQSKSVLIALLVVISLGTGVGLVAASEYNMTVPGATDIPEQTEEGPDGNEYTVDAFAAVGPGEEITVSVTVPHEDDDFRVELLNSDQQVEALESGTGSESVTFDISENIVGTHLFVLYVDGDREAIHPLVISGYEVTTTDPEATDNEDVEIEVGVDPTTLSDAPESVEVAVWDGDSVTRESTSDLQADGDRYRANVSLGSLSTGEYEMYAVAQGEETVQGEPEVLGISDGTTIEISESSENEETNGDSGDGQQGDAPIDEDDDDDAPIDEDDDDEGDTANATEADDSEEPDNEAEDDRDTDTSDESVDNGTEATTDSDVLTPTDSTVDETDDDAALHLFVTIIAVIMTALGAVQIGRTNQ